MNIAADNTSEDPTAASAARRFLKIVAMRNPSDVAAAAYADVSNSNGGADIRSKNPRNTVANTRNPPLAALEHTVKSAVPTQYAAEVSPAAWSVSLARDARSSRITANVGVEFKGVSWR
jgi:hypothetical protein